MLYQIKLTQEQRDALIALVERAPKVKTQDDKVKAIGSINIGQIEEVKTRFHFTCNEDNEGKWTSEYFPTREECWKCMKATLLETAAEEMSVKNFDDAAIHIKDDEMTLTLGRDDKILLERTYELFETEDE